MHSKTRSPRWSLYGTLQNKFDPNFWEEPNSYFNILTATEKLQSQQVINFITQHKVKTCSKRSLRLESLWNTRTKINTQAPLYNSTSRKSQRSKPRRGCEPRRRRWNCWSHRRHQKPKRSKGYKVHLWWVSEGKRRRTWRWRRRDNGRYRRSYLSGWTRVLRGLRCWPELLPIST